MYDVEKSDRKLEVVFSAALDMVDAVTREVKIFLNDYGMPRKFVFDVQLGILEALTNAVCHGSGSDPAKKVRCILAFREDDLHVMIQDEGGGFDWREVLAYEYDPLQERGRGMHIIKLCFDSLQYNGTGNSLELVKEVPEAAG